MDELDLSQFPCARPRLKEWVTTLTLSIRRMRCDQYQQPSCLHWYMSANSAPHMPIFPGDTRVTVCNVVAPAKPIAKRELLELLANEAPHFMRTIINMTLPTAAGRLRVAVIETDEKRHLQPRTHR